MPRLFDESGLAHEKRRFEHLSSVVRWKGLSGRACAYYCDCCQRSICVCSTGMEFYAGFPDFGTTTKPSCFVCDYCKQDFGEGKDLPDCRDCFKTAQVAFRKQRAEIRPVLTKWVLEQSSLGVQCSFLVLEYFVDPWVRKQYAPELNVWQQLLPKAVWRQCLVKKTI